MLCTLGVFNASLMNDAIFKFKRYEDSSLSYTGIDKHEGMDVGGWDSDCSLVPSDIAHRRQCRHIQ